MAIVTVPYQSELTAESAMEIFRRGFWGRYEVSKPTRQKSHFEVKKNWTTAVSVGLRQGPETATKFVVAARGSSPLLGVLMGVQIVVIFLLGKYMGFLDVLLLAGVATAVEVGLDRALFGGGRKALEGEVVAFIENAPEFRGTLPGVAGTATSTAKVGQPVLCASCSTPLAGPAQFCQVCGTPVPPSEPKPLPPASPPLDEGTHCTRCGTLVPQSSLFCHKCGAEVAPAQRDGTQTSAAASKPVPKAPLKRGYCDLCGQELEVNEKLRGLTTHQRCPTPAPEAPASAPNTDAVEMKTSAPAVPLTPDEAVGSASTRRGYCDLCGRELGVDEKLMGLTAHRTCPMPVSGAPAAAPAQASQVYCAACQTPMPASNRFCHKCGSAAVAAAE